MEATRKSYRNISTSLWLIILLIPCIAYFILRSKSGDPTLDSDTYWYSGWLWNHGFSPYSQAFDQFKWSLYPGLVPPGPLVYPPHFWVICAPLALVSRTAALFVWPCVNLGFFFGGLLLWRSTALTWKLPADELTLALLACLSLLSGTGLSFDIGQTGFLVWFGFALFAHSRAHGKVGLTSVALALLLLKPQIGLTAFAATLARPQAIKPIGGALLLTAIGSLPAVAIGGLHTVTDFLHNVGDYKLLLYNGPLTMSGAGNIVLTLGHIILPNPISIVLAAMAAGAASALVRAQDVDQDRSILALTIGFTCAIAPLHTYDLLFIPPILIVTWRARSGLGLASIGVGLALIIRPENIAVMLRHLISSANVASIGCLLILFHAVLIVFWDARSPLRSSMASA